MNTDTKNKILPSLVGDVLTDQKHYIDNLFATTWSRLNFNQLIKKAGFSKRSGTQVTEIVFVLLLWKWLNVSSISFFSRHALEHFSDAKKDALYDLLRREDINWREFNLEAAKEVYRKNYYKHGQFRVFVIDDSIKTRRGKKMEGVSSHYDHVSNRHVMGQQVLTLGLATEDAFLPLDSQIFVSKTKAKGLNKSYQSGRSVAAKRYLEATTQSKPEMTLGMIKRAKRKGIEADYFSGDAWFGTKIMVKNSLTANLDAVLRMKKNKLKYALTVKGKKKLVNADELYTLLVKRKWRKVKGLPWKAVELEVELDLSNDKKSPEWQKVKLLFVRGLNDPENPEASQKSWALFLCTDLNLSMCKILEIYSLRWGIEVYFKEAKQHLGFLKEQTTAFASHIASIHLCAIRYLMLVQAKHDGLATSIGDGRSHIQNQLDALTFAGALWQIFRSIISDSMDDLTEKLGNVKKAIMETIDIKIQVFFEKSLQLDAFTLELEHQ